VNSTPGASQPPKDWPAEPVKQTFTLPSARPPAPWVSAILDDSIPPTQRLTFLMSSLSETGVPSSSAARRPG
jgi:hypothetical protein